MFNLTTIDRIFSKLSSDYTNDFEEGDVIEWTAEALDFIGVPRYYEQVVSFMEVKNYGCILPSGTQSILQIAKNNCWNSYKDSVQPCDLTQETPNLKFTTDGQDMGYVVLDQQGMPLVEYDVAYYRPYYDWRSEYFDWTNSSTYKKGFTPIRKATSVFFGSDNKEIVRKYEDEYQFYPKQKMLKFSFCDGQVAIARLRTPLDDVTGYPMIPDDISYTTAIVSYIVLRIAKRAGFNHRDGSKQDSQEYERDWQWYCSQAAGKGMMPDGIDELQNLQDSNNKYIDTSEYYGFFGNMNKLRTSYRRY